MDNKDIILIGQAINGLNEARDMLRVLVDRRALPQSWSEIESVLGTIQEELCEVETEFASQTRPWSAGAS